MNAARAKLALAWALALAAAVPAPAGAITDPTQPPRTVVDPAREPSAGQPIVQTIIIKPHSRSAIIDGERVELGGTYRDAQVIRITESEVVLRQDGRTEVLRMYPDVEKKAVRMSEPAEPKKPPSRRRP